MLKKLLLILMVLFTLFVILVFKAPELSKEVEGLIGLPGLSDKITGVKDTVDQVSTDIPTLDEVKDTYDKAYSGAIDAKNTITSGITDTKNIIDETRKTLSGAEAIYNDAKGVYEGVKDTVDSVQGKLDTAKELLEDGQKLQDTLSENLNKEILE